MMSPANKDETQQGSGSRKTSSSMKPPEQALTCPRCDSPNTKFCYYNNYSLTQPRHFCKTCRRYWTKGGALRNVPIGGGCRKNKKIKSSSRISGDSKDSAGSSSDMGGLKFFNSLSPAMDFQLGGLNYNFPRFHPSTIGTAYNHQYSSYGDIPSGNCGPNLMGFNFPSSSSVLSQDGNGGFGGIQEMGSLNIHNSSNLASSIESLSSINQDLHWKLQQQRLGMFFGGESENQKHSIVCLENQSTQKPQPILFQNLEISKTEVNQAAAGNSRKDDGSGSLATEWFFDNSNYAPVNVNPTPTNSGSTGGNGNGGIHETWSNFNQFSMLP